MLAVRLVCAAMVIIYEKPRFLGYLAAARGNGDRRMLLLLLILLSRTVNTNVK